MDRPRLLQHAQVSGHRRVADGQLGGELPDRQRALAKPVEDRPPERIPQSVEDVHAVTDM
jgi:hypothetical protein